MWAIDDERLLFLHTPDSLLSRECWAGYKQADLDEHHANLAMSISHPTKGWQHRGRSRFQSLKDSLWIKLALFPVLIFYFQCKVTKGLRLTKMRALRCLSLRHHLAPVTIRKHVEACTESSYAFCFCFPFSRRERSRNKNH